MRLAITGVLCAASMVLAGCGALPDRTHATAPQYTDFPDASPQVQAPINPSAGSDASIQKLAVPAWVSTAAEATGIPERVMSAYAGASLRLAQVNPSCALGWNTFAGIGAVETFHGTYKGASVDAHGNVSPRIIGIALDGSKGLMTIEDTDQGKLDGDTQWDRAVGPMQFIPSTWAYIGQDGNGDGVKDPHHIDDVALSAATYLCHGQDAQGKARDVSTNEVGNRRSTL